MESFYCVSTAGIWHFKPSFSSDIFIFDLANYESHTAAARLKLNVICRWVLMWMPNMKISTAGYIFVGFFDRRFFTHLSSEILLLQYVHETQLEVKHFWKENTLRSLRLSSNHTEIWSKQWKKHINQSNFWENIAWVMSKYDITYVLSFWLYLLSIFESNVQMICVFFSLCIPS